MDSVLVKFAGIASEFEVSKILDLGFTEVRWYGAIIAFGFLLAVLFGGRIAYVWNINLDKMIDVLVAGFFGAVIGARGYYVLFRWDYYSSHLSEIVRIWDGGLAIYGGIIGGILCAYIIAKIEKLNFYNLLDLIGMSLLIGQGIGRWGNYANQEAFGGFTYKNFGMMSETVIDYISRNKAEFGIENVENVAEYIAENDLYVHPTFFYESLWCILGFFVLYIILKKYRKFSGQLFLSYGVWYGLERFIVEGMRTDSLYIGNTDLRVSQLLSLAIVLACGGILIPLLIKYTKNYKPIEGVDFLPYMNEKEKIKYEKKLKRQANGRARRKRIKAKLGIKPKEEKENV